MLFFVDFVKKRTEFHKRRILNCKVEYTQEEDEEGTFRFYETRRSSVEKVTAIRLLFIFLDISFIKQTSNWRSHTNANLWHYIQEAVCVYSFSSLP